MFPIIFFTLIDEHKKWIKKIFDDHHIGFVRIAKGIVLTDEAAEDVVSASYIKIIEYIDRITQLDENKQVAYCVTIVKNNAYDYYNKEKRETPTELVDIFGTEDSADSGLIFDELIVSLKKYINNLTEEEKHFIYYRFNSELKYSEIAKLFGISEDAAKKRGQRLVKKIKEALKEEELI